MKRTELITAAILVSIALTMASCQKDPQPEPEKPQKVSLTGSQWECHNVETQTTQGTVYTITDDMLVEFETDSSGYWEITTFFQEINCGTVTVDFTYEFDGVTSGKITLSPESDPTPGSGSTVEYIITYDAAATTILLEKDWGDTISSYLFHKKQ